MTPQRIKRPELLLSAAALLIAAAVLLAVGAAGSFGSQIDNAPSQEGQTSVTVQANPFEAQSGINFEGNIYVDENGSYAAQIVGYTGVVVFQTDSAGMPIIPEDFDDLLQTTTASAQAAVQPSATPQASYPVNLNTATQAQLETLPGIGPVKAQAILAWRAANGAFSNANQLLEINGIGEKTLQNLLPYITW